MTKDKLVEALTAKLSVSRRTLKGYAQSKYITELLHQYTSFLPLATPRNIRCWHLIYNVQEVPRCLQCNLGYPKFNNNKWGYLDYCSVKCQRNSDIVKSKLRTSLEEKYGEGVTNPFMSEVVKDKIKARMTQRFGVDHNFKRKDIVKERIQEKYGVDHYSQTDEFKEKYKRSIRIKHGVDHYSQTSEFIQKCRSTWQKSLGVDHPMHDANIASTVLSKLHKTKKFVTPTGKTLILQGYEPYAYCSLLEDHDEDDIVTGKKEIELYTGKIYYIDSVGKIRRYFPDFYIISVNKIIEVKSSWTFNRNGKIQDTDNINLMKRDACLKMNFKFEFMIVEKELIKKFSSIVD